MNQEVLKIERLMVGAMRRTLKDVDVKVESTLMDRWYKTDGVRDAEGRLIIVTEAVIEAQKAAKAKKA